MPLTSTSRLKTSKHNLDLASADIAAAFDELQAGTLKRTATAATYTATATDPYIGVTSTAAARTINLPAAATVGAGKTYIVKDESGAAGTNNVTIDPNGSETIDGAATKAISTNYGSLRVVCGGTNWFT